VSDDRPGFGPGFAAEVKVLCNLRLLGDLSSEELRYNLATKWGVSLEERDEGFELDLSGLPEGAEQIYDDTEGDN